MAKVIWSDEAVAWLRGIDEYLTEINPNAAASVVGGVLEKANLLESHPRIGERMPGLEPREVRSTLYGRYRLVYEVIDQEDAVRVLAIIHTAMDIDRLKF